MNKLYDSRNEAVIGTARSVRLTNSPPGRDSKVQSPNSQGSKVRRHGHWSQEYSIQRKNINRNFNSRLKAIAKDKAKKDEITELVREEEPSII